MFRRLLILVAAICLAATAWAGDAAKKDKKPEPGTSVEMPFLIIPMSDDSNLLGYAYVSSKLVCSSPSACITVREKLAFIQDGFVRDVNSKPLNVAGDPREIDRDLLNARLTAVAKRIVGADKVQNMVFLEIKFAPLHPGDSTATEAAVADTSDAAQGKVAKSGEKAAGSGASEGATSQHATGKAP